MKKILIIEDELFLKKIYKYKLVLSGFEVTSANSAEKGLKMLEKEIPNLILLDILLPGKSGIEFLAEIRKNKKFDKIAILAFSNYDDPKIKKEAIKLKAKDYLIKSDHTPKEIVDKINGYI